jgi:hypothetical protein
LDKPHVNRLPLAPPAAAGKNDHSGPRPEGRGGRRREERRRKKKKEGERERKIRFETELVIKYCVKRLLVIISQKKIFLILNYSAIWHHPDLERDEKAEKRR